MDNWAVVTEVDVMGETKQGKPKRGVKVGKGWLQLTGDKTVLMTLLPGQKIRHSEPKQFGKSWYATLQEIESPAVTYTRNIAWPKQSEQSAPAAQPAPSGNGHQAPGVPTWQEYKNMAYAASNLAHAIEKDLDLGKDEPGLPFIDRSTARAAIVNTIMIAFTNGKVQAPKEAEPEIPGADAPFPEEHEFPWSMDRDGAGCVR